MPESSFSLLNKTRGVVPAFPFEDIKDAVLGRSYALSLVFLQPKDARRITKERKHKDKASNVLAFPLSKRSGEILLCPATARHEALAWGVRGEIFLLRLFIHGLLHLKGMQHGDRMDNEERRVGKRFGFEIR